MMATAFMGYILPWGQMSFWGATVITGLFGAIPGIGEPLQTLLLGGPAVDNATLNRFFSLHYLLPFIITWLVIVHIWAFHTTGNNNPTGVEVRRTSKTEAKKDGDDYVINGTKMWISNSTQADYFCLLANTSDDQMHKNKSLIIVPSDTKGVSLSEPLKKLGLHSSDTAQIFFDDVRVPQRNLIGDEGKGFIYQMMQFQEERLYAAAAALKGYEDIIQDTIEYTKQRETFGKPIIENQAVHFRLAELQTEVELLRALTYSAVEEYIDGKDVLTKASMAKLKSGRLGRELTDACLQYWGGMGFMWETSVARAYRDTRLGSIGGGSDEVMLGIISKQMGMLKR